MSYHFDPMKSIQALAVLLKDAENDRHNYTALLKMLYIADRESIRKTGSPITGDRPVAMDFGPVLSQIYDLLKDNHMVDEERLALWSKYMRKEEFDLELLLDPGDDRLSDFEVEILEKVFAENGKKSFSELVQDTHRFPEWAETFVQGTSTEIHLKTILEALGMEDRYEELSTRRVEDAHFAKIFDE